jgi:glycosyltransferase involved in cell wall biosynthesis
MKISVVVPTYRRPSLLHNCLLALVNQKFDKKEYEVIIVSDGPDEQTRKKVLEFQHTAAIVSYHCLTYKKGPAAARNVGWQQAKAALIAFTDDDCVCDEYWLDQIWNAYKDEDEVVYTGRVIVPLSASPTDHELNTSKLETAEFVTANCICAIQALKKVQGFDERFKAAWREDSDLHFKLLEHRIPIYKNEKAIVYHPVRAARWGISIKEQSKTLYNALLYKKHPVLYRQRIKPNPSWNYYLIIILSFVSIVALAASNYTISVGAGIGWAVLTGAFIFKRLEKSSHSFSHVTEMVLTSLLIPFLSVFWTLYGAYKYKVLFF